MSGNVEVFLDEIPGETRGVIARNGVYDHLLIHREGDVPQHRLGARCVGRIDRVDPGLKGAFVSLGGAAVGYLAIGRDQALREGQKIAVQVTAEPRESKAAALRLIGPGEGEPRLVEAGPGIAAILARLAPGVEAETGLPALRASLEAEDEARSGRFNAPSVGLDLAVQRTRALIAVDIDHAAAPGADPKKGRRQANLAGLRESARLIRLKRWGGLVAIDLVGTGHDAAAMTEAARSAFGDDPEIVFGPINRFGVMMLSLPWRSTPIEEVLGGPDGQPTARSRALDAVRRLKIAMLSDTATPRFVVRCVPDEAALAGPLVARLGPRAHITIDPGATPGHGRIEEG